MSTCLCTDPNCANECHARPGLRAALRAREATLAAEVERKDAALKKALKACRCGGTGKFDTNCTLCGDSTFDHECNDREVDCTAAWCIAVRAALRPAEEKP